MPVLGQWPRWEARPPLAMVGNQQTDCLAPPKNITAPLTRHQLSFPSSQPIFLPSHKPPTWRRISGRSQRCSSERLIPLSTDKVPSPIPLPRDGKDPQLINKPSHSRDRPQAGGSQAAILARSPQHCQLRYFKTGHSIVGRARFQELHPLGLHGTPRERRASRDDPR